MSKEISQLQYDDVRKQIGHYKRTDYHPEIRPAGRVVLGEELEECFKDYKLEDALDALKSELRIRDKPEEIDLNFSSRLGSANSGIYTGVKSCLEMTKQTPFQSLIGELRDTAMSSYWKKEVGKIPDQTPNLPDGMDPIQTIFGKYNKSNETAAELVNPQKTGAEIMKESRVGHRLYRKSHNDYYPSEQINREYVEPFRKNSTYGKGTKADKRGSRMKQSMRWLNQDVASTVSMLQANFLENTSSCLGRAVVRTDVAPLLEGRTFGKVSELESNGVGELLRNFLPNTQKLEQKYCLEHINTLRLRLKKRVFPFMELYQTFLLYNKNGTQIMTMEEIYSVLRTFQIHPDRRMFETLLNSLNLIRDGKVRYKDIVDILSWKCDFPLLPRINDVSQEHQNYSSTYKDTFSDAYVQKEKFCRAAGLSTERVDVPYAVVPIGGAHFERENLGDQTSVATLISPNIFTQKGLSHLDFFRVCNAQEMRSLFENIGVNFPGDSFNVIWNEGFKKDGTGGVCIETFRGLLDQLAAATYDEISIA